MNQTFNIKERKERVFIYSAFIQRLKALKHGSHNLHQACLPFVSFYQMAPPLNVVANI